MDRVIMEAALRVLNARVAQKAPAEEDVMRLREAAAGPERNLAAEVLAARIVDRAIERGRDRRRTSAAANR